MAGHRVRDSRREQQAARRLCGQRETREHVARQVLRVGERDAVPAGGLGARRELAGQLRQRNRDRPDLERFGGGHRRIMARRPCPARSAPTPRCTTRSTATDPPLVFAHGAGGNTLIWFQQVPHFARTRARGDVRPPRLRPLDLRARPTSTRASSPTTCARSSTRQGIERAALVCQSMGGWTGLRTALEFPERVVGARALGYTGRCIHAEGARGVRAHRADRGAARESAARPRSRPISRRASRRSRCSTTRSAG